MTDTQPGDGLPPSEPTQDIGDTLPDGVAAAYELMDAQSAVAALQAERDALAAQLARVQAVIDELPSEPRMLSQFVNASAATEYSVKRTIRQQLEAALKGEAE